MRLGDLIEWGGRRWVVRRIERETRTAIIHDGDRTSDVVPDDLEKTKPALCRVVCNPSDEWPFVAITQRPKFGRLLRVSRPVGASGDVLDLGLLQDWLVADPTQPGGALFFNPALNLHLGDQLLATYEHGRARIQIPREFLSTAEKIARAAAEAQPAEPRRISVYERLRRNAFADDDDE